jgi:hypothetical protein
MQAGAPPGRKPATAILTHLCGDILPAVVPTLITKRLINGFSPPLHSINEIDFMLLTRFVIDMFSTTGKILLL